MSKFMLPLILVALVGCQDEEAYARQKAEEVRGKARMVTVEYEGHKFIHSTVDYSYHAFSTVHHPDCSCGRR